MNNTSGRLLRGASILAAVAISAAGAQKQELVIAKPLAAVAAGGISPTTGELTAEEARTAIIDGEEPDVDRAYLIHVVRYLDAKMAPSVQNRYVYDEGEQNRPLNRFEVRGQDHYKLPRIFGRKKLAMVYLHIAPVQLPATARDSVVPPAGTDLNEVFSTGASGSVRF